MVLNTRIIPGTENATDSVARSDHARVRARSVVAPALRTSAEIEAIRAAGSVVRAALDAAAAACVPGARTRDLDEAARVVIEDRDAEPLFLYYPEYVRGQGFPGIACTSVNEQVIHGVPGRRVLHEGDLVSIDCGARLDGWCADAAITVAAGTMKPSHGTLVRATEKVLELAVERIRPGLRWSSIASEMESSAAAAGFGVVADYVGHGIGRKLHEAPSAPSVLTRALRRRGDFTLRPGMVLAVEPMLVLLEESYGKNRMNGEGAERVATVVESDGWTVRTASETVSCHVEHTIVVTRSGSDILTAGTSISCERDESEVLDG